MNQENKRIEKDSLGSVSIDINSLYGINAFRGAENFDLHTKKIMDYKEFVRAFAQCKWAAALANYDQNLLSSKQCNVIVKACKEMVEQELNSDLIVELLEGSGGTSTNMNVNEVLANRANILLREETEVYDVVNPNDHLNCSQSTNDVYPTALKLATYQLILPLLTELEDLIVSLKEKEDEFASVITLGRTCLQDAQPMRLGQRFSGFASGINRSAQRLKIFLPELALLPLGATAIGTGFGSKSGYKNLVHQHLSKILGYTVKADSNPFDAMQNLDGFAVISSYLKIIAAQLAKIANDLTLLSSGPVGGLGEVVLPSVQAGSSIMPGKINPVQPISMCQIFFIVSGNDQAITQAVQSGQLEINHYEPIVANRLFESISLLTQGIKLFNHKCIKDLRANEKRCLQNVMESSAIATALVPTFGYGKVSEMVNQSMQEGISLIDYLEKEKILDKQEAMNILEVSSSIVNT